MQHKLAHYQIKELLGEGSFAWVCRAYDQKFEQDVALKLLKPIWMNDPQAVARFKREARTVRNLRHPHIVDVYDVGEAEGKVYLTQRLVDGETLADRLARGPLPWEDALKIVTDIASALDYAHREGIIHRDIKPANILLGPDDKAFLGDFGLVRAVQGSASLSASGGTVGTGHYMAPEVWDGKEATPATDVYAFSCVVFEMLTGEVLFEGSSMMAVLKKHADGPKLPKTWPAGIPTNVNDVLNRGLAEDPAKRMSSAGKLSAQLAALGAPTRPAPSPPVVSSTKRSARIPAAKETTKSSPPWLLIGGAVFVVLIIFAAIIVGAIAFFVFSRNGGVVAVPKPTEAPITETIEEAADSSSSQTEETSPAEDTAQITSETEDRSQPVTGSEDDSQPATSEDTSQSNDATVSSATQSIGYGQTVAGKIAQIGDQHSYTFQGQEGERMTALLKADIMTLILVGPNGKRETACTSIGGQCQIDYFSIAYTPLV